MCRWLAGVLTVLWFSNALANEKPQILSIQVIDHTGQPVPNAWVRVPKVAGQREVEPADGLWEASQLTRHDGSNIVFNKGMVVDLTVCAPGFYSQSLQYEIRSRRNVLTVALQPMPTSELNAPDGDDDTLMRHWFERPLKSSPQE